jgi:hypothetical protein
VDVKVCLKEVHELVSNKVNVTTCTVQNKDNLVPLLLHFPDGVMCDGDLQP